MGGVARAIEEAVEIPYTSLSGFRSSTVSGHAGKLLLGHLGGTAVVAMSGRSHYYEGCSPESIILPVQVLCALGIKKLIVGNASGGINPRFRSGQVMVITDHLDLMFRGQHGVLPDVTRGGETAPRRPARGSPYSIRLVQRAQEVARRKNIEIQQGIYAALTGPNYETRSEYRMLRKMGADVVGMSTIPEAMTAASLGVAVCGLSTITNVASPDVLSKTTHEEVITAVNSAEKDLVALISELVAG